ncbi:tyrosine-type recombinase/integrase [Nocardia asteroides]|uniref:tyrosine-type recombinase/integrase n=1 Tax=Nocardia asteroides TaxID=1824 RepID=UPI0037C87415
MSAPNPDSGPKAKSRRAEPINTHTAKNGKTTYWFQVDIGVRADGKRDRPRFTFDSKTEARREYRRISTEVANGTYVAAVKTTVGEFLAAWLDGRRDVRRVTVEGYRDALKPVIARLGGLPLQQLTKAHVDELVIWRQTEGRQVKRLPGAASDAVLSFVSRHPEGVRYAQITEEFGEKGARHLDRLRAAGHVDRPRRGVYVATDAAPTVREPCGVSERTVVTMLTQLTAALEDALNQGLVTRNVARLVKRPDMDDPEMHVWTRDQVAVFREHVRKHRLYALFLLSLCGLRRSEIMGLRWFRIDGGTLAVARGRVAVGKDTDEGDPKSRRSRRSLSLPADVVEALRVLKLTEKAEALAVGVPWSDDRFVAVEEDGSLIRPEWYSDEFQRQAKAAGVPVIRLHDARHTAATVLLDSGVSVSAAAKWLGHDPAVLLRRYAHVYPEALEAAGAALFGEPQSATGS